MGITEEDIMVVEAMVITKEDINMEVTEEDMEVMDMAGMEDTLKDILMVEVMVRDA